MKSIEHNNLNNQLGATSIFVMIFMVVLLVFGLAALTTSLASLKLADKNHLWSKDYYVLEAQAEETLSVIDGLLEKAELQTKEYFVAEQYQRTSGSFIDDENQKEIAMAWEQVSGNGEQERYFQGLYQYVYLEAAKKQLATYVKGLPEVSAYVDWETTKLDPLKIDFSVSENKATYPKNINVTLQLVMPIYDIKLSENGALSGQRSDETTGRFIITKWQEWQIPFEYSDDLQFENPNFENPDFVTEGDSSQSDSSESVTLEEEPAQDGVFSDPNE